MSVHFYTWLLQTFLISSSLLSFLLQFGQINKEPWDPPGEADGTKSKIKIKM